MNKIPTCHPEKRYASKGLCTTCYNRPRKKQWRLDNKEKYNEQVRRQYNRNRTRLARSRIEKLYGITENQYVEILARQNGVCALCFRAQPESSRLKRLMIDHDHETGKVRGLLCAKCNLMLGLAEDNINTLNIAIKYLEKAVSHSYPE